jgi:hypothetical protein
MAATKPAEEKTAAKTSSFKARVNLMHDKLYRKGSIVRLSEAEAAPLVASKKVAAAEVVEPAK